MLHRYQTTGTQMLRLASVTDADASATSTSWVDAIKPSEPELEILRLEYGVPNEFLTYALDPDEHPRFEQSDEFTLIVVQAAHWLGEGAGVPYDTVPLAIILAPNNVITICEHRHTVMSDLRFGRLPATNSLERTDFTLHLLLRVAQRYLQNLRSINRTVEALENHLESSTQNRELLQLMRIEKSLVYFRTALRANATMLERIRRNKILELNEAQADQLEDIHTEMIQALEMTDVELNILSTMMGAFASIISNNLNVVVRVLTVATILVAVPTWITGVFGMNVSIPGMNSPWAFPMVLILCLVVVWWLLGQFRKRRWL
jgi:magnesium transporter